jgi:hypothetical protein
MFNDDATQPDLRAQHSGSTPSWPRSAEDPGQVLPRALSWPVLLLAHGSTPGGPSLGGPGPLPSATPTPTARPTATPQPTPTHHHHHGGGSGG